jgi:hypothetical protein
MGHIAKTLAEPLDDCLLGEGGKEFIDPGFILRTDRPDDNERSISQDEFFHVLEGVRNYREVRGAELFLEYLLTLQDLIIEEDACIKGDPPL